MRGKSQNPQMKLFKSSKYTSPNLNSFGCRQRKFPLNVNILHVRQKTMNFRHAILGWGLDTCCKMDKNTILVGLLCMKFCPKFRKISFFFFCLLSQAIHAVWNACTHLVKWVFVGLLCILSEVPKQWVFLLISSSYLRYFPLSESFAYRL